MLEIKNPLVVVVLILFKHNLVVVVLILFKHNGLSGQAISSSQLCSQSILCNFLCMCNANCFNVMYMVVIVYAICKGLLCCFCILI